MKERLPMIMLFLYYVRPHEIFGALKPLCMFALTLLFGLASLVTRPDFTIGTLMKRQHSKALLLFTLYVLLYVPAFLKFQNARHQR